jgi:hypothetical protein
MGPMSSDDTPLVVQSGDELPAASCVESLDISESGTSR